MRFNPSDFADEKGNPINNLKLLSDTANIKLEFWIKIGLIKKEKKKRSKK